ncbi:MAG: mechanosensitive ion channel [Oscillospiraceae bacterium]|nr:mechanosensitive ion channel [Oscillospiraceae bacterium]
MDFINEFLSSIGLAGASRIVSAIVIFLICLIAIKVVTVVVGKALDKSKKLEGNLKGFIKTALKIVLWALAIIIVAGSLGIDTASLVAVLSIAGLALSLSVQNVMSNLFSGITLLLTRPFVQGDLIEVGANLGTVKSVGLFYTVIDTLDNRVVSIPNGDVTAASIVNYSRNPLRRVDFTFNASYDSSTESVKAAILEAIAEDSRISDFQPPFVVIGAYKESTVEYIVRVWCDNADYWDVYFGLNERVRESFARNGVKMSYPHVNVHVVNE